MSCIEVFKLLLHLVVTTSSSKESKFEDGECKEKDIRTEMQKHYFSTKHTAAIIKGLANGLSSLKSLPLLILWLFVCVFTSVGMPCHFQVAVHGEANIHSLSIKIPIPEKLGNRIHIVSDKHPNCP